MTETPEDGRKAKDLIEWLGFAPVPDWSKSRTLGAIFGVLLCLFFLVSIPFAAVAVPAIIYGTIHDVLNGNTSGPNLGAGALITALLGAPFLIWSTVIKHKSLGFQKEGHLTDRISKAVEQLGAEKKVDRIGRPVTIWTGGREGFSCDESIAERFLGKPRTKAMGREWRETWNDEADEVEEGYHVSIVTWASERTLIEWQGEPITIDETETIGVEGAWQVFSESLPNIEVRIGGILSLERIAQDSTAYDKGRDHVRCMEILCAYIRENAPAKDAKDHDLGDWQPLRDDPTEVERQAHLEKRKDRFGIHYSQAKAYKWVQTLSGPRADIAQALQVIGRRTKEQRQAEAHWGKDASPTAEWVFDTPSPFLPDRAEGRTTSAKELAAFRAELSAWKTKIVSYQGYRLDLRNTNLQRAELSDLILSGANLGSARMEGANLMQVRMEGAYLSEARMEGANLSKARMEMALLRDAWMEGANLSDAQMVGADLFQARMEGANLIMPRMEGANLSFARMEGANLGRTRMVGANLTQARMEGANLSFARMEGAKLGRTRMEGANLWRVQMDADTVLTEAKFSQAFVRSVGLSLVRISLDQVKSMFGDASVILPNGITPDHPDWPAHWPKTVLNDATFVTEWRKWLASPSTYTPPSP